MSKGSSLSGRKFCCSSPSATLASAFRRAALSRSSRRSPKSMHRQPGVSGDRTRISIVAKLVNLMRGTVGVESQEGLGSRFWFTACFGAASAAIFPGAEVTPAQLRGKRILAVDDNATNLRILAGQLKLCGVEGEFAKEPEQAIQIMQHAASAGHPFDIVLLDFDMPSINGGQLGKEIQEDAALRDSRLSC